MLKRIVLTTAFFISCHCLYAQYISPNQLSRVFNLWQSAPPDSIEMYLHAINRQWKLDLSSLKTNEDDREVSWLFIQTPPLHLGMIQLVTLKTDKVIDKAIYFTDQLVYYQRYVAATKASKFELVNYSKSDNGMRNWVYEHNGINYILSIYPPNSKGVVIYQLTVQGYNTN